MLSAQDFQSGVYNISHHFLGTSRHRNTTVSLCLSGIHQGSWRKSSRCAPRISLNLLFFGTETLKKVQTAHIRVGTHIINRVDSVRNIGAIFDEQMRMEKQVGQLCKSA